MKMNTIRCLAAVAMVWTPAWAQQKEISEGLVSTGRVLEVSKETGDVTLRSQQAVKNLVFRGLKGVPVYYSNGHRGVFGDIEAGQSATIYYVPAGGRWRISKIVIPDPGEAQRAREAALTPAQPYVPTTRRGTFHVPRVPNTFR